MALEKRINPGPFYLSSRSRQRLQGIHPDLALVVNGAITRTAIDFTVLEGLRTPERQARLFDAGATRTLRSRHLTGHAVDLGAWLDGQVAWDWPLYHQIADAMLSAADEYRVPLEWGGHWRTFKDGPHFQLPWDDYPPTSTATP